MSEKNEKEKKAKRTHIPYTNRELSWLSFNERVLEEAYEKENPLLERLKFLSITASNLDEFFMVRVAGLREQARMGVKKPYPVGQSPSAQLRQIGEQAHFLCKKQYNCLRRSLLPMLRNHDILIVRFEDLDAKQKYFDLLRSKRVDAIILAGSKFLEMRPKDNAYITEAASELPIMLVN